MSKDPLSKALCNEFYLKIGRANRQLLDDIRREKPNAHKATLAEAVLCLLDPEESGREAQRGGDPFFRRWINEHDGDYPTPPKFSFKKEAEKMENEDLLWVGLAVMIAVAGGALYGLLQRKRNEPKATAVPPVPPPVVSSPKPEPAFYAVVVFSGKVKAVSELASSAGDLLTQARSWWFGSREKWDRVAPKAGLSPIDQLPESDDIMLAIVYEVSAASRETPSSRPEAATRLRDASGNNHLDVVGMYSVGDITKLKSIGFRH